MHLNSAHFIDLLDNFPQLLDQVDFRLRAGVRIHDDFQNLNQVLNLYFLRLSLFHADHSPDRVH